MILWTLALIWFVCAVAIWYILLTDWRTMLPGEAFPGTASAAAVVLCFLGPIGVLIAGVIWWLDAPMRREAVMRRAGTVFAKDVRPDIFR